MNIPEHRKAIDKLDTHIVRLLNQRTRHVLAIGDIKLAAGEEIYAPHRERAVFERVETTLRQVGAAVRDMFGKDANPDDVLSAIESGQIGRRSVAGEAGSEGPVFARRAKAAAAPPASRR